MTIPNNYDPTTQGWYLLPVEVAKVPSSLALTTSLTIDQINELNAHTIQGLIELVYIRVGNDVLYGGLNGLDVAIDKTARTLELLSAIQELHNSLQVSTLGSFSAWFEFSAAFCDTSKYQSVYNSVASAFFGVPIFPEFIFKNPGDTIMVNGKSTSYQDFADSLKDVQLQLRSNVNELASIDPAAVNDQNSLYRTSLQVLCDLPPIKEENEIAFTDAKLWALDYYTIDDGKDWAQNAPKQTIIKVVTALEMLLVCDNTPGAGYYRAISLGNDQLGMGCGKVSLDGGIFDIHSQNNERVESIRVGPSGLFDNPEDMIKDKPDQDDRFQMPGQSGGGQILGTLYLTFSGRMALGSATVFALNPMDAEGDVANRIESGYLGSFAERGTMGDQAGSLQANITTAITAAQGLNTTQQETVQSYLFTFQEYYKSASALLNKITQLVEKYAQNQRPA